MAIGLLVIPGGWLYTRWSLATPVIREESVGPLAAMRRSNQLVRGHFWFVFITATVAYYLEGVVIHEGALVYPGRSPGRTPGGHGLEVRSWRRWSHTFGGLRHVVSPSSVRRRAYPVATANTVSTG